MDDTTTAEHPPGATDAEGHFPPALVSWAQLTHPDRSVHEEAVLGLISLAEYGDEPACALLREVVHRWREVDPTVYLHALNRIGLFGDERLADAVLDALHDPRCPTSPWAVQACGRLGVVAAEPALVELLDHEFNFTREAACEALGDLGASGSVPALARTLDDPWEFVREAAADALARIGGHEAVEALWSALLGRRHLRLHYLAQALARVGTPVHERLVATTTHPDPELRYWAAFSLGSTGEERFEPVLTALLDDHAQTRTRAHVSTAARRALKRSRKIRGVGVAGA